MTIKTLPALFQNRVYEYKHAPFIGSKSHGAWHWTTWEDSAKWVEKAGRALLHLGVAPGDRVAIVSENRAEWVLSDLAVQSIGAVSVPIYPTSSTGQLEYILNHSQARAVFTSALPSNPNFQKEIMQSYDASPTLEKVIYFDPIAQDELAQRSGKWIYLNTFLDLHAHVPATHFYHRIEKIQPDDLSTIIYTSGTTGNPKGVMLTQNNILSNCEMASKILDLNAKDITLSFLPLSHAFERTAGFYGMIYMGVRIAYAENMGTIAKNILEISPTILFCVPRVLEKIHGSILDEVKKRPRFIQNIFESALLLAESKNTLPFHKKLFFNMCDKLFFQKIRLRLGGKLNYIISGGAKLNPKIALFFDQVGIPVLQGYGLTETSPIISVNPPHKNKIGSVGPAVQGVEVKTSEDGEIIVRGPLIMKGYYKDENATREVIDSENFFHTGDIGLIDQDGYLFITDRKKELIVTSGGKKVAPQTIESLLTESPYIEQACLVGEDQKYLAALIVPNFAQLKSWIEQKQLPAGSHEDMIKLPEVHALYANYIEGVCHKLASYESIKKFELLPREFSIESGELTPTLKLKRKVIFENHSPKIKKLYDGSL